MKNQPFITWNGEVVVLPVLAVIAYIVALVMGELPLWTLLLVLAYKIHGPTIYLSKGRGKKESHSPATSKASD